MSDLISKYQPTSMKQIVELALPFLQMGRSAKFTVVGNSMFPLFRSNMDKVTVVQTKKVKKRDVILYRRSDGNYIFHRVVGKGKLGFKLCGDDQLDIEYPVKEEDVVAVMTSFERNGKETDVKNLWYRIYSFLWCISIKKRPLIFKTAYKLKKIFTRSN